MDVSWIPGDNDLIVAVVAGLVVLGGVAAALVGKARQAPPRTPAPAPAPVEPAAEPVVAPPATVEPADDASVFARQDQR